MNKTLRSFYLLVIVVPVLISCSKKVSPTAAIPAPTKPVLNVQDIPFEYFHGKARMVLRDANKEREVKANIRVRKDSVIWMTFSVIGLQGGKALINKDSITIVSNVDKEYYVFEYTELSQRYNFKINYDVIQAAMLGNLLLPRKDDDEIVQESSMFLLKQQAGTVQVTNYVNAASMKVEKVDMKESNSTNSLVINYSNFQPVEDKLFPYNGTISLFYKTLAGVLNTTVIFEYNKAEVGDKELKFPFNIPKRYVRR
jgi:hypothetical protein